MNDTPRFVFHRSLWYRVGGVLLFALLFVGLFLMWSEATYREELDAIVELGEPVSFDQLPKFYSPVAMSEQTHQDWRTIIEKGDAFQKDTTDEERLRIEELPSYEFFETSEASLKINESCGSLPTMESYLTPRAEVLKLCQEINPTKDPNSSHRYSFDTFVQESTGRLPGIFELRRSLWLAMLRELCQQQPRQAVDRIEQMAAFYKSNLDQPTLVESLVRLGFLHECCRGIEMLCQQDDISDEDLKRCRRFLDPANGADLKSDLRRTLITERAFGIEAYRKAIRHPFSGEGNWFALFLDRPRFLGIYGSMIEESGKQWPEMALYCKELDSTLGMEPPVNSVAIAKSTMERFLLAEAILRLADTSLAIRLYGNAHHRPPQSLEELVPEYSKYLPLNPIMGTAMQYEVDVNGVCRIEADASLLIVKPERSPAALDEADPIPKKIIFKLRVPTKQSP